MSEISEYPTAFVITTETFPRTYPKTVVLIKIQSGNFIIGQRIFFARYMVKTPDMITIISVKAIGGSYPYKSFVILANARNTVIRQAIFLREMSELNIRKVLRGTLSKKSDQED
jgi:hypothetical protein